MGESDRDQRRGDDPRSPEADDGQARPMLAAFTAIGYSAAWSIVQNRRPGLLGSLAQYNYEQWLADLDPSARLEPFHAVTD